MRKKICPTCGSNRTQNSTSILFDCIDCGQEWFVDCRIVAVTPLEKQAYFNEKRRCAEAGSPPHPKWDCKAEFRKELEKLTT